MFQIILLFLSLLCLCTTGFGAGIDEEEFAVKVHKVNGTRYLRECVPLFKYDGHFVADYSKSSNYYLMAQPSGICQDAMTCAFIQCDQGNDKTKKVFVSADLETVEYDEVEADLPPLNLPSLIAFPKGIKDVAQAVHTALVANLSVSIKTSGHSYTGASTHESSLQLNLRDFSKYSQNIFSSVVKCDSAESKSTVSDSKAACRLAVARGKTAYIRVGGGEIWDEVYRSVENYNRFRTSTHSTAQKYEIVGGFAGTVSAVGGWLQGGGLGKGMDRLYGLGVDQVLELEMVLADGSHVKFGPTLWTQGTANMLYPQTTEVNGKCNAQLSNNMDEWSWRDCDKDVPFGDLWKAVRGGGGGSYGIVTAALYQLHPERLFSLVGLDNDMLARLGITDDGEVFAAISEFFVFMLWNPELVGLDQATSWACGSCDMSLFPTFTTKNGFLLCKDDGPVDALLGAWRKYVPRIVKSVPALSKFENASQILQESLRRLPQQSNMSFLEWAMPNVIESAPIGRMPDHPSPTLAPENIGHHSALPPVAFFLNIPIDDTMDYLHASGVGGHLLGGAMMLASDGMDSVSVALRQAAFQASDSEAIYTKYRPIFRKFRDINATSNAYIADTEYNHIAPDVFGPLKSNFDVACPKNWTTAEKVGKCISLQESVWGTEHLAWLEDVKSRLDPSNIFKCFPCVGYDFMQAAEKLDAWRLKSSMTAGSNFVVQRAFDASQGTLRSQLVDEIKGRSDVLSKFTYGHHALLHLSKSMSRTNEQGSDGGGGRGGHDQRGGKNSSFKSRGGQRGSRK